MSERAKPLRYLSISGSVRRAGVSRGDLQLCVAALLAGSGWLFSINALAALPPLFFMGSRFILAGVLIGFFADIRGLRKVLGAWVPLAVSAGAMALSMIGWILALKHTSHAGVAAFITATGNLMVPLVGALLFRWPLAKSLSLSLPLACAGLALLFLDARTGFDTTHLLFLGAALLWAISVALMKNANPALGTATITAFQLIVAGLSILAASCLFEEWPRVTPSLGIWMWFLASVLLSTCLRFALQYQGQRLVAPARAAMLMSAEPVWTMALSTIFLATSISPLQAVGCAVIFAAVTHDFRSHPRMRDEEPIP